MLLSETNLINRLKSLVLRHKCLNTVLQVHQEFGVIIMGESGQTKSCIRVLHLENDPLDAELIETALKEHNIPCSINCAYTQEIFEAALQKGDFDLILSDSQLPGFDTLSALTVAQERYPQIPFIFVSGTASPKIKGDAFRRTGQFILSQQAQAQHAGNRKAGDGSMQGIPVHGIS